MADVGELSGDTGGSAHPGDRQIGELADRQYGVVAHRQLVALGFGRDAIQHRLDAGRLRRIHRGVFSVGHRVLPARGHWLAAVLACGPASLLSHESAAALWGFRDTAATRIHVSTNGRRCRCRPGIVIHRPRHLLEQDRCECDEVPVTSVPRTLLDLGASLGQTDLRRAFGRAERLEILDFAAVEELIGRTIGHRGLKRLRVLLGDLTPATATRSELERRFLELVRAAGLPQPAVSITVAGLEVDAVWLAERLAVEVDGYAHHRGREAFERDRERELILAAEGFELLRFTWLMIERGGGSAVALVGKKLAERRARLAERRARPTWAS